MSEDQVRATLEQLTQAMRDHTIDVKEQFRDQNKLLGQLREDVIRNEERQNNTFSRMFGAPGVPGVVQYWETENTERRLEIASIRTDVAALKQTSLTHRIYWAGIAAALGLLAKLGLSKAGIHF